MSHTVSRPFSWHGLGLEASSRRGGAHVCSSVCVCGCVREHKHTIRASLGPCLLGMGGLDEGKEQNLRKHGSTSYLLKKHNCSTCLATWATCL